MKTHQEEIKLIAKSNIPLDNRPLANPEPNTVQKKPKAKKESKKFEVEFLPGVDLFEMDRLYILKALSHFKQNRTKTANALGITPKTLRRKLHKHGEFENFRMRPGVKRTAK